MPELITEASKFQNIIQNNELSVVHFAADWAEQCKQVDDVIDLLSEQAEYSNVKFIKLIAEDLEEISLKYNIEAVPTTIFYQSGKVINRVNGADPAKLRATLKQHLTNAEGISTEKPASLDERLKTLINKNKVMLFMKGDPETPKCGFSRQIIEILKTTGIEFDSFDILTDEEVRQGLKTYSDWPTYPQLYIKGELMGGLDIVKEMQASGELLAQLTD